MTDTRTQSKIFDSNLTEPQHSVDWRNQKMVVASPSSSSSKLRQRRVTEKQNGDLSLRASKGTRRKRSTEPENHHISSHRYYLLCSLLLISSVGAMQHYYNSYYSTTGIKSAISPKEYNLRAALRHRLNRKAPAEQNTRQHQNSLFQKVIAEDGAVGYLNDDYCDFEDGRDEPATAACSHRLVMIKTFSCRNDPQIKLFASRVRDGVIDCPDGSDEL